MRVPADNRRERVRLPGRSSLPLPLPLPFLCGRLPRALTFTSTSTSTFSLIGGAVVVEGRIEAFAIGERLNPTTSVVHFEKANPELRGMYQLINQWFSRNELSEYSFVNREQDLGLEDLRKAKESYQPHHMARKFIVRP